MPHGVRLLLPLALLLVAPARAFDGQDTADLVAAARESRLDALATLLHEEPDLLNAVDERTGQTALISAVVAGKPAAVRYLLEQPGVEASKPDRSGYTAWDVAAFTGSADVADVLAQFKVPADREHEDGFRPVHRAAWGATEGHVKVLARMLAAGLATPNDIAGDGSTPLSTAMETGKHAPIIRMLIMSGADTSRLTDEQRHLYFDMIQAAQAQKDAKRAARAERLKARREGTSPNEDLFDGAHRGDLDMAREALERGADIDFRHPGHEGRTALMTAALEGRADVARLLLERGADPAVGEDQGYSPIHGAAFQGRDAVLKVLLEHGLDPLDFHSDGLAPIHRLAWGRQPRFARTARVLLEAGRVPADLRSKQGKTALQLVAEGGRDFELARALVKHGADAGVLSSVERERVGLVPGVVVAAKEREEV